jgi:hypothetical protein
MAPIPLNGTYLMAPISLNGTYFPEWHLFPTEWHLFPNGTYFPYFPN